MRELTLFCHKKGPQTSAGHISAVRARFELAEPLNRFGSLANCWIQPLSHLTVEFVFFESNGLQIYNFFQFSDSTSTFLSVMSLSFSARESASALEENGPAMNLKPLPEAIFATSFPAEERVFIT